VPSPLARKFLVTLAGASEESVHTNKDAFSIGFATTCGLLVIDGTSMGTPRSDAAVEGIGADI